ncbi:MAG: 4-hydroxy-tetrahydrodipicolinate synthase [Flavobacteriales bacterium]|nr:4-hydroxy-tetrahydrodipicolinate synthase [Flavobacteriales bacterium]MCB9448018.1 4-hydroxy-tetrahydrodipicolinate synthase [Flavobacteriales bacterium]
MIQKKLTGTGVAIVTPFKGSGIDFQALGKLVDFQIKNKVDYIVVLGTTGESVTLSKDEKVAVVDYVVEEVNKRVPVVLGLGGNNTQEIIHGFSTFDLSGIDAILSVSPYYNKPTQKGIYQHFRAIANASPLPILLYNVPARTSSNMTSDTTLKLAHDFENIIGIKEAAGNLDQCAEIVKGRPKNFLVISGDDAMTLPFISLGADGVISVAGNAFPKEMSNLTRLALDDQYTKARNQHLQLLDIFRLLFVEGNPGGIKAALEIKGLCANNLRLPLVPVGRTTYNKIAAAIEALN